LSSLSISCILPALNEVANISTTVKRYSEAIEMTQKFLDYELILINDGSTDQTGPIMDKLAQESGKIKVIHHIENQGLGKSYRDGLNVCKHEYVLFGYGFVPHTAQTLSLMFNQVGNADVVLAYVPEIQELNRGVFRHFVSWFFVSFLNMIFKLKIYYYNGQAIYPTRNIKTIQLRAARSGAQAEATVKLLSQGLSYVQVGFEVIKPWHRGATSSSVNFKNMLYVIRLIGHLFLDVRLKPLFKSTNLFLKLFFKNTSK